MPKHRGRTPRPRLRPLNAPFGVMTILGAEQGEKRPKPMIIPMLGDQPLDIWPTAKARQIALMILRASMAAEGDFLAYRFLVEQKNVDPEAFELVLQQTGRTRKQANDTATVARRDRADTAIAELLTIETEWNAAWLRTFLSEQGMAAPDVEETLTEFRHFASQIAEDELDDE